MILIDKWMLFGDAIDSERGIDEALRQTAYDLLGIDHVFRHGTSRVPAGTDVKGLRSLVECEVGKHRANLERSLNARSDSEREMAQLGLARFRDSTTNSLRGDLNRARQRFNWARDDLRAEERGGRINLGRSVHEKTGRRRATPGGRPQSRSAREIGSRSIGSSSGSSGRGSA